jgi:hypothetical protein
VGSVGGGVAAEASVTWGWEGVACLSCLASSAGCVTALCGWQASIPVCVPLECLLGRRWGRVDAAACARVARCLWGVHIARLLAVLGPGARRRSCSVRKLDCPLCPCPWCVIGSLYHGCVCPGATGASTHTRVEQRAAREAACLTGAAPRLPGAISAVDHAPCGLRACSVYTADSYTLSRHEGVCYATSLLPGNAPAVALTLFYNGGEDNMGDTAAPDSQAWQSVDTECYLYAEAGAGRLPVQVSGGGVGGGRGAP